MALTNNVNISGLVSGGLCQNKSVLVNIDSGLRLELRPEVSVILTFFSRVQNKGRSQQRLRGKSEPAVLFTKPPYFKK